MIDLHTHVLPGVDDGASDLETALTMLKMAEENGVRIVAATPHFGEIGSWLTTQQLVENFRKEVVAAGIGVELVSGGELLIDLDISGLPRDELPTFNGSGKYALVEFPLREIPRYSNQVIFALQTKGIVPIIAHPERNTVIMNDPNALIPWIDLGCIMQMNAGSIMGIFGETVRKTAEVLLENDMIHLLASDAHSTGRRGFCLHKGHLIAKGILGEKRADDLVDRNPQLVLEGRTLQVPSPQTYKSRKRFWFF